MKIVVALDSFKGSMTAVRACEIVAQSVVAAAAGVEVIRKPMADGGEGTASALMAARGGLWVPRTVTGPLPQVQVDAGFVWLREEAAAVVEMAAASGVQLLSGEQMNPLNTTTLGTGELIRSAVEHGAARILLAVGGSATVDGGVGAAMALGWRFLDGAGRDVGPGGGRLAAIRTIVPPKHRAAVPVEVLCDVDNPLCGEHGAARVYGPQKGATPEMVEQLEAGLCHLADLIQEQLGRHVRDVPGAGAAGGLAAGALAFLDGRLVSGIDTIMAHSRLREALVGADWALTGEGRFDGQSLRGKVVSGVARMAREAGARVGVLAGQVTLDRSVYKARGIDDAVACIQPGMDVQYAIAHGEELLAQAARRFALAHLL